MQIEKVLLCIVVSFSAVKSYAIAIGELVFPEWHAKAVNVEDDYFLSHPMTLDSLLTLCPYATGEIKYISNGHWVSQNVAENPVVVPIGPLLCFENDIKANGIDLGFGYSIFRPGEASVLNVAADPPVTQKGIDQVARILDDDLKVPKSHWYEVEVSNVADGKACKFVALAVAGASRSAFPRLHQRIGVEAGGTETIFQGNFHFQTAKVPCGVVRVRLLRKAFEIGWDEHGNKMMYHFEDLPQSLLDSVLDVNPEVIVALEGSGVPVLGSNLLAAWGLQMDAIQGLVKRGEEKDIEEEQR